MYGCPKWWCESPCTSFITRTRCYGMEISEQLMMMTRQFNWVGGKHFRYGQKGSHSFTMTNDVGGLFIYDIFIYMTCVSIHTTWTFILNLMEISATRIIHEWYKMKFSSIKTIPWDFFCQHIKCIKMQHFSFFPYNIIKKNFLFVILFFFWRGIPWSSL